MKRLRQTSKLYLKILILMCLTRFSVQDEIDDTGNEIDSYIDEENSKFQLIFPGTKWCGDGSIATHDNDYGPFVQTDMCCKAHDFCPDYITSGDMKYNLTNNALFTKVHCDCDVKFHGCLKDVNTIISQQVGSTYFNVVGSECFKLEYPAVRCAKYSVVWKYRCMEYELDKTRSQEWQFFDNPLY